MEIKLRRFNHGNDSTGGLLLVNDDFFSFTCEDQFQEIKVMKETRIPAGRYKILLRDAGGMNDRYKLKFPKLHRGMLHLQDVPDFEYVYIHIGNDDDDTEGCILVGAGMETFGINHVESKVSYSTDSYLALYNLILLAMQRGEEVWIDVDNLATSTC